MNCKRKALNVDTIDETSGRSSKTLAKSLDYVKHYRPAYVLLENVAKKITADVLVTQLQALGYKVQPYFVNSVAFGVPQSRTRLYVVAVDPLQVTILAPPAQWTVWLQEYSLVQFACHSVSVHIVHSDVSARFPRGSERFPRRLREVSERSLRGSETPRGFQEGFPRGLLRGSERFPRGL